MQWRNSVNWKIEKKNSVKELSCVILSYFQLVTHKIIFTKSLAKRTDKLLQVGTSWTCVKTCVGWSIGLASFLASKRKSQEKHILSHTILYFIG